VGAALQKQRESYATRNMFGAMGVDYVVHVPLAAAEITGFRHDRSSDTKDAYREVTTLEPINRNSLRTKS